MIVIIFFSDNFVPLTQSTPCSNGVVKRERMECDSGIGNRGEGEPSTSGNGSGTKNNSGIGGG